MSVVYIGHIGKGDQRWVLKIAESLGTIVASLNPCISKNSCKRDLPRNCQYCMIVKMGTKEQAASLVEFIGTRKWSDDFCLKDGMVITMDVPLIYAKII